MQQIIINLVNNAIKFTEAGEIVVALRGTARRDGHQSFELAVTDSGVGIAPHLQEKVFDQFAQADGSTARKFGGTGLGLTICRQLVRLMGGDITLRSAPGAGSSFRVSLSLPVAPDPPAVERSGLDGVPVLLVENHPASRDAVARRLTGWKMAVTTAASIGEAADTSARIALIEPTLTDSLRTAHPDLIVLPLEKPLQSRSLRAALHGALADSAKPAATPRGTDLPKMRGTVLLAEDNEVNKTIVLAWLRRLGLSITHAHNGLEAVAAIRHGAFDLVLMDCQMPEMDGFAATEAIRKWEADQRRRRIPIIALTANAIEGDRETCLRLGMDDYLPKPFKGSELAEMLQRWLPSGETPSEPDRAAFAHLAALCQDYADHGGGDALAAIEAAWTRLRPKS